MTNLVVRGPVFTGSKVVDTGVRVEDGVIVAVSPGDLGRADRLIKLGPRQTLLPAAIDTLCALRDWGEAQRETVETATKAALAGGVTVVCDQPNTSPRISTPELIRKRAAFIAERSYVDFGVQAHPPLDARRIDEYRDAGAVAVCLFQWDLRPWNYPRDADDSPARFRHYAELGLKALFFPDELTFRETPLEDEGETYALDALLRRLHPDLRARIFITLASSVERILAAKERFPDLLIQIAPHYLFMSREEAHRRIGIAAAHSPPLRSAGDVARLQEYVSQGSLDIFVSHHTPHRIADKYSTDAIPGEFTPKRGFTSVDFAYPLYLTRLGFALTCRHYCESPARHLGLKKGFIGRGYEADLVVVEESTDVREQGLHESGELTRDVWRVDPSSFHSLGKVTPFVGERLKYRILKTFLRGEEAYDAEAGTFRRLPVRQVRG